MESISRLLRNSSLRQCDFEMKTINAPYISILSFIILWQKAYKHRRKIKTEDKLKVVTVVWGTELIQLIVALAILYQDDWKKGNKGILFFISSWCNSSLSLYCPGAIHPILQIVKKTEEKAKVVEKKLLLSYLSFNIFQSFCRINTAFLFFNGFS